MINREYAKQCVGPGWSKLLDRIYDILPEGAYVSQVKEKFGGLRFYVDGVDDETFDMIQKIETESYETCEVCGKPGKVRDDSYIKTRCDDCYKEEKSSV